MIKPRLIILCASLAALMLISGLFAQDVMRITRKDKTFIDIPTQEIDNIKFLASSAPVNDSDQPRDADGNLYKTVKIGNQVWMAENLRSTKYMDGSPIPEVKDDKDWKAVEGAAMCWPKNDKANYFNIYGALYNWEVVNSGKIAPPGWRVPTQEDFEALDEYLSKDKDVKPQFMLMTNQKGHWTNNKGTNETGFSGYPGYRREDGSFQYGGISGAVWSSTMTFSNPKHANRLMFNYGGGTAKASSGSRKEGHYIRFIKE